MGLVDRTNETTPLSLHGKGSHLYIDLDSDSSYTPSTWVHVSFEREDTDEDGAFLLTLEEAESVYQRLALVLGK